MKMLPTKSLEAFFPQKTVFGSSYQFEKNVRTSAFPE
jgi:hypothetical protein